MMLAPGALSAAPFAPPTPSTTTAPPRPTRGGTARSTRCCRGFRRIVAHGQPRTGWVEGERLDCIDRNLIAGQEINQTQLFLDGQVISSQAIGLCFGLSNSEASQ